MPHHQCYLHHLVQCFQVLHHRAQKYYKNSESGITNTTKSPETSGRTHYKKVPRVLEVSRVDAHLKVLRGRPGEVLVDVRVFGARGGQRKSCWSCFRRRDRGRGLDECFLVGSSAARRRGEQARWRHVRGLADNRVSLGPFAAPLAGPELERVHGGEKTRRAELEGVVS